MKEASTNVSSVPPLSNHACTQLQHIAPAHRPAGEHSRPPLPLSPSPRPPAQTSGGRTIAAPPIHVSRPQPTARDVHVCRETIPHGSPRATQHVACSAALRLSICDAGRGWRFAANWGRAVAVVADHRTCVGPAHRFRLSCHHAALTHIGDGVFRNAPRGSHAAPAPTQLRVVSTGECGSRSACGATPVDGGHVSPWRWPMDCPLAAFTPSHCAHEHRHDDRTVPMRSQLAPPPLLPPHTWHPHSHCGVAVGG